MGNNGEPGMTLLDHAVIEGASAKFLTLLAAS
jgi:hypothetical protein